MSTGATTDYAGNYVYENNTLQFFNQPEGYVEPTSDVNKPFQYVYQYKDHLGNIRLSYKDSDGNGVIAQNEIIEEKNYYPFGMTHKGYNNNKIAEDKYHTYNGKEFELSLGLNMLEMDFRQYDPTIGRFKSIDLMSEESYCITPYRFGFNNPISFNDPTGLWERINGGYRTTDKDEIERFLGFITNTDNDDNKNDTSINGINNFILADQAFTEKLNSDSTLPLTGITVNGGKPTPFSVHRTVNEISYYQGKTNYLYNEYDYALRNRIFSKSDAKWLQREIIRLENDFNFKPLTAKNYIAFVGGQTNARLGMFSEYFGMMSTTLHVNSSISNAVTPRYLGRVSGVKPRMSNATATSSTITSNTVNSYVANMSFRQFHQNFSYLYRGRFPGRGSYMKAMAMDYHMLKAGL